MIRLGNENNNGAWAFWIELRYPAKQGRVPSTQIPRVERARGDGEACALAKRYCDKPGRSNLFLRSACTQRIAAPASINEWPGRLIGIKACARRIATVPLWLRCLHGSN